MSFLECSLEVCAPFLQGQSGASQSRTILVLVLAYKSELNPFSFSCF